MTDPAFTLASDFDPASDDAWRALVEKGLKGRDFDRVMTSKTAEGIVVDGLYTADSARIKPSVPGREGDWKIDCCHWNGDISAVNKAVLRDLERGADAITLVVAAGEWPGVPGQGEDELARVLDGVYLDMAHIALMPGEAFDQSGRALLKLAGMGKIDSEKFSASLGADPVGTLARTGRLQDRLPAAIKKAAQLAMHASEKWQCVRTISADGNVFHNAGATASLELAAMLSNAVTSLRAMEDLGMSLEAAAGQLEFSVAADADLYLTIAKMRTARRLWDMVQRACGLEPQQMHLTACTSIAMYTLNDPWVNILRQTVACFGAGVGGADRIIVLPHSLRHGLDDTFARRIARNVQVILQEESSLSRVADPAAGSWAMESLTTDLTDAAWSEFQKIEAAGGISAVLLDGSLQSTLDDMVAASRTAVARRKKPVTGVSEFPDIHEEPLAGSFTTSFMAAGVEVREHIKPLTPYRYSGGFEDLRQQSDEWKATHGKYPQVFLANLGTVADYTARSTFAKNWFEAIGVESLAFAGSEVASEIVSAWKKSGAEFAVICGRDEQYSDIGVKVVRALAEAGCGGIWLAGKGGDAEALSAAGLTDHIAVGGNLMECAARVWELMGEAS